MKCVIRHGRSSKLLSSRENLKPRQKKEEEKKKHFRLVHYLSSKNQRKFIAFALFNLNKLFSLNENACRNGELEAYKVKQCWKSLTTNYQEEEIQRSMEKNLVPWNQQTVSRLLHCLTAVFPLETQMRLACFDGERALFLIPIARYFYDQYRTEVNITGIYFDEGAEDLLSNMAIR